MKKRKLIPAVTICLALGCTAFVGCDEGSIELYQTNSTYKIARGQSLQFETKLNNLKGDVIYEVIDGDATINNQGKLTADTDAVVGDSIKVVAKVGNIKSNTIEVTVNDLFPTSITLTGDNTKIALGGDVEFTVSYNPTYATVTAYTLTVSDGEEFAEINSSNKLVLKQTIDEAEAVGEIVKVKATLNDKATIYSEFDVEIVEAGEIYTLVAENVNLNTAKDANKTLSVSAYNEAGDAISSSNSDFTFSSSDETVAFVNASGTIIPKGHGEATITITAPNSTTTQCKVFVMVPPTTFALDNVSQLITNTKTISFSKVDALELDFDISNSSFTKCATKLSYEFNLLDDEDEIIKTGSDVATVDNDGKITFKEVGKVAVKVTTNSSLNNAKTTSNEKSIEFFVNVNEGTNISTVAEFKTFANSTGSELKVANILTDLYLDENNNFGIDGDSNYSTLYFKGDVTINGNGYVLSNEQLPLLIRAGDINEGGNMLEFIPNTQQEAFSVSINNFEVIGCGSVAGTYNGELAIYNNENVVNTAGKYIKTYRRGIVISGTDYADPTPTGYVENLNMQNVKISGFDVGLRVNHAVNGYISELNISNCFSNGIESNQNILTLNNTTIGQVGAFAIEITPDDMKDKTTANPSGTAGANYNQTPKLTMTGYIHCSNFNNGASTPYMNGLTSTLGGTSIPTLIQAITVGMLNQITTDPTQQAQLGILADSIMKNNEDKINFYLLIFIDPTTYTNYRTLGNTTNVFATYESDSSLGNMIDFSTILLNYAQDPTYEGYKQYQYIKFDLQTGPTLYGNIGQIIMINQAYDPNYTPSQD